MTQDSLSIDETAPAIDVQDLHKYFGDNEVLTGINFHVTRARWSASSGRRARASRRCCAA